MTKGKTGKEWGRVLLYLAFGLFFLNPSHANASCATTEGVRNVACETVQAFGSKALDVIQERISESERERKLLALFHSRFDVRGIGIPLARCVGANWDSGAHSMSNGERQKAADLIGRYIVRNLVVARFGDFIKDAREVRFEVRYSAFVGNAGTVTAALIKDKQELSVRFHLTERGGGLYGSSDWRIKDMCIETYGSCMLRAYTQAMCEHAQKPPFQKLLNELASPARAFIETLRGLVEGKVSLVERERR